MLALIFTGFLSSASAQVPEKDVAEPALEGCWGPARWAFPEQSETDVPLNIAPRFYLLDRCVDGVQVELADADGNPFDTELSVREHDTGTSVIVDPTVDLPALTTFVMTITTEFGVPSELWFTTGSELSTQRSDLQVLRAEASGRCRGERRATYSLSLEMGTDAVGVAGFVRLSESSSSTWQPILALDGRANATLTSTARVGATEVCASIVRIEDDGTLGEWQEVCATTPDLGDCSNSQGDGCGCSQQGQAPALLAFLPLLGLLGLRRQRK